MKDLLAKYLFHFPRDTGDGGAGAGGAAPPAGSGAAGSGSPAAPDGAGDGTGTGDGGEKKPDGGTADYWPEGIDTSLRGKDSKETLDNLAKTIKGYRDRDAGRDMPKSADEYLKIDGVKGFELDPEMKPFFDTLAKDDIAKPMFDAALKAGIDRPALLNVWQAGMKAFKEAGLTEPPVDVAAERAALLPDAAKNLSQADQDKAIDKRMTENLAFLDLMTTNRALPKEASDYVQTMLGDSAKGHAFIEWIKGQVQGGGDGPGAHGDGGGKGDTREGLRAELAKMEKQRGTLQFDQAKYSELDGRYKKLLGSS